jgi:hypothetical protein
MVYDGTQPGGVMTGLSGAGGHSGAMTDDASPKGQWDMTIDESRFGMRTFTPSAMGDIKTRFELDFLGTSKDQDGKTAAPWSNVPWNHPISGETKNYAHVRQMYGEWNGWLFGKADNNFEDPDGSPNYLDWDGMLADWYGCGRDMQIRYTAALNPKTTLSVAIERNDSNTIANANPNYNAAAVTLGATSGPSHTLPGDLTARLNFADTWGHIAFAGAFTHYEQFVTQPYTAATTTPVAAAIPGSTAKYTENAFSWALSGHFQLGPDSLVYKIGVGSGQWGAGLNDGAVWAADKSLQVIQAKQLEVGFEHVFTPKIHGNLFVSSVGYDRDVNKGMTGAAFRSYRQAGANVLFNSTRSMHYGIEYVYGEAKTFDADTLFETDGSTTSAVHESRLHFQASYKFN